MQGEAGENPARVRRRKALNTQYLARMPQIWGHAIGVYSEKAGICALSRKIRHQSPETQAAQPAFPEFHL